MSRRFTVRITYADGTPGLSIQPTIAAARAVADAPTHGGRAIADAEVLERLASGAEVPTGRYRWARNQCPECERVFDMLNPVDSDEWANGHDCEVAS